MDNINNWNEELTIGTAISNIIDLEKRYFILQDRIDKTINDIDILQEIIYQQSTNNKEDDFWLLDKLDGIKNTLKGGKNE